MNKEQEIDFNEFNEAIEEASRIFAAFGPRLQNLHREDDEDTLIDMNFVTSTIFMVGYIIKNVDKFIEIMEKERDCKLSVDNLAKLTREKYASFETIIRLLGLSK